MRIFSRMLKRFGARDSSCGAARSWTRPLGIEPLEERRLLAIIAAPVGFKAVYDIGSLGEQFEIDFEWADSTGETGYEIESVNTRSITVRDYPAGECEGVTLLNSAKSIGE